jgi:hypothetical protein
MPSPLKVVSLVLSLSMGLAVCSSSHAKSDATRLAELKTRVTAIADEIGPFYYPNPVTGKPMPAPSPKAGGEAFGR